MQPSGMKPRIAKFVALSAQTNVAAGSGYELAPASLERSSQIVK